MLLIYFRFTVELRCFNPCAFTLIDFLWFRLLSGFNENTDKLNSKKTDTLHIEAKHISESHI